MNKRLVVGVFTLVLAGMAPGALAGEPAQRAVWIWDSPATVAQESAEILDFIGEKGIDVLYLHAPPGFSEGDDLASFVTAAGSAGVTVYAMAGTPEWSTDTAAFTGWVEEVVASGLFSGVVADVEPYLLDDWGSKKRNRLIRSYLNSVAAASGAAGDLPFFAAVPFWWDQPEFDYRRAPLVEAVIDRVSGGVVVMAYRDTAELIASFAAAEVALAAAQGKIAVVGVETNEVEPEYVTFFGKGEGFMESQLAAVEDRFGGAAGFGGFAIHDLRGYLALH